MLPPDIARIRHTWTRRTGDAWTTESFRAPVIEFLGQFLTAHAWAESMAVVERFLDSGVHRRVPFGVTGLVEAPRTLEEGFRQSDGTPVLVLSTIRRADRAPFEVALPFKFGAMTSTMDLDFYLVHARASLEAAEARSPVP